MSEHLSRDEMIQRLYGMDAGASHLEGCPECGARFQALESRRAELAAAEEIPADLLAAQRRAVYSRMGERPRSFHSWVPALATAALVALGIYVYQPVKHYPQKIVAAKIVSAQQVDVGDAQLFSEAVSIEQTAEPLAVAPIHGLFEGNE
jgi:anti-sigma factor RsiW